MNRPPGSVVIDRLSNNKNVLALWLGVNETLEIRNLIIYCDLAFLQSSMIIDHTSGDIN